MKTAIALLFVALVFMAIAGCDNSSNNSTPVYKHHIKITLDEPVNKVTIGGKQFTSQSQYPAIVYENTSPSIPTSFDIMPVKDVGSIKLSLFYSFGTDPGPAVWVDSLRIATPFIDTPVVAIDIRSKNTKFVK